MHRPIQPEPPLLNGFALACVLTGMAGVFVPGIGFVALLCAWVGRWQTARSGASALDQDLLATGRALGWLGVALTLLFLPVVAVLLAATLVV
ncbi:MAG TPA: hypothetical protein VN238_04470 [Solirubrobacteraceae bacterium]|nr:hypothetical protein [Solirubrobacteraceae bacterium]